MSEAQVIYCKIFESDHLAALVVRFHKVVIITDSNIEPIYGNLLQNYLNKFYLNKHYLNQPDSNKLDCNKVCKVNLITIQAGEYHKTRSTKEYIEDELFKIKAGRDSLILALGGGVVTDLAGFVSATYCRGLPVIYIPTSLLGMVDASLGGKTGLNTSYAKNIIGTFTEPLAVFIDSDFLKSLPQVEYVSAFAEIIKHALIDDFEYFDILSRSVNKLLTITTDEPGSPQAELRWQQKSLLDNIIERSVQIKSKIVSQDSREKGQREVLNFGHTIGHAIETATNYTIQHGYAVAWGMIAEAYISCRMNILSEIDFSNIVQLVKNYKLLQEEHLISITEHKHEIIKFLAADKKNRSDQIRMVLLEKIGSVKIIDGLYAHVINQSLIVHSLSYLLELNEVLEC